MKHIIYIFTILLWIGPNFKGDAQNIYNNNIVFRNARFTTYIIKVDNASAKKFKLVKNEVGLAHKDFIEQYIANHDTTFFAINACINNSNKEPLGWFQNKNQEINPMNLADGNGNFFLKPNGVLAISNSGAEISETQSFLNSAQAQLGTQSGPMLVIDEKIHPSFNEGSPNLNIRCGVGLYQELNNSFLVFAMSNTPVNFYDFASFFKEYYHCKNALCLESTNSVLYCEENSNSKLSEDKVIGNYLIYDPNADDLNGEKCVIPMEKEASGLYQVPVELNNVLKISFIFDSGASDVSISPDVAFTLIRTGTITPEDFIGKAEYTFADGSKATSAIFLLREIKIGNYHIRNVRASISNSLSAPMLLGQSILQRIGKWSVDNNNHTLTIEKN